MKQTHRLRIVGAGMPRSLDRSLQLFEQLAAEASDVEGAIAYLDHKIESELASLEDCLRGRDSFDTLAFLRFAAGPWDFSNIRESETLVETSQAAQDVIALTLLGMGLPRQPLTGENSGQPDIGTAMKLAGQIIEAARARALFQGRLLREPLGALAGEFLGYELSVRGRHYDSIATDFNTELFEDVTVDAVLRKQLGFTLTSIRSVREASTALLNERFFGARDRIGDLVKSGVSIDQVDADAFRRDMNLMVNECRLFGAVSVADVARRSAVDEATTKAVLDFFSTSRPMQPETEPVATFVRAQWSIPGGSIADDGEHLILNGFLSEDELRRNIERGLIEAAQGGGTSAKGWAKYDRRRAAFAELRAGKVLGTLFGGLQPRWTGQKYLGPVTHNDAAMLGWDADHSSVQSKEFESDLLFVIDGVAICVEVKAGSVTDKARGGNAKRLATDLEKTLKEGNEQADRLSRLIHLNQGVWSSSGKWIDLKPVGEVHSIVVMLDDMGPLSLSMNELAHKGIIETAEVPWIISLHDLVVISRTVDHPAQFLEYLRRRRGRRLATMVNGVDELDMFMWFLDGGMYFESDPREVAAQIPTEIPVKEADLRRFHDQSRVRLGTLTDTLDAWFYSTDGLSHGHAPKPTRLEEPWVEVYLAASESAKFPGWLRFGADLVGLSGAAQRQIEKDLNKQCRRARNADREYSLTTHGTTSWGSWLLTAAAVPNGANIDHLPAYIDAKQYQTKSSRSMLLLYRPDGSLLGSRYCGEPEPRTPERDAEIAMAPLYTLAETFRKLPPSASRTTKQLRGKRSKPKRR